MSEPAAQFVLIRHVLSDHTHWDLMFDIGPALATWQLQEDPAGLAGDPKRQTVIRAQRIGDHRRAYLDYEGPVSGNRGYVVRVDAGRYEATERRTCVWQVRMDGQLLRGEFQLMKNPDESWAFRRFSGS